jgi:geranylgeranyl diphosphate synthase, type I
MTSATTSDGADEREAFATLLDQARGAVGARLATWLSPRVRRASEVSAEVACAASAVESLSLRGGKRMRAALVRASFEACGGGDPEAVLPAMLAVELLQVYLLVHDDWMDDDDTRRGGPAVHVMLRERLGDRALGDAAAVLAGDLASAYAQEALLETAVPAERVLRAARAFARIQEDVVIGQLAEMHATADARGLGVQAAPTVEQIHALKTASYTVTGPLALGALLAGAGDSVLAHLERYGRPLGIAFQLRDDLLGVFGDATATGKPVWNDLRQGKRTALVAEMRADASAATLLERVLGRTEATTRDIEELVSAMDSSGARRRVEARVSALSAEARRALAASPLPPSSARSALFGAIRALGERSS